MFRFILRRALALVFTLIIITALIYACLMLFTPEERATLYLSPRSNRDPETLERLIENIIDRYHMRDPYPIQYIRWLGSLLKGNMGYSPIYDGEIFPVLLRQIPVTLELTLFSLLTIIPLGLLSGVIAGWKKNSLFDVLFRIIAFTANSLPIFILAFVMLAVFYITLYWFAPGRLGIMNSIFVNSSAFNTYTGLVTVDGILNGRYDITWDAIRHLMLPVITLGFVHWATLARIMRTTVIEESAKEYVIAATARGAPRRRLIWFHIVRNAIPPGLTSTAITSASLITGVFIVEIIFDYHGVSGLIIGGTGFLPDVAAVMAFTVYSIVTTLLVMFVLDVLRAIVDPRIREDLTST